MILILRRIARGTINHKLLICILTITGIVYSIQYINKNTAENRPNWKSNYWCIVNCMSGVPCEYMDEVDFRIIVLVFNRSNSVNKSLSRISQIEMQNDKLAVDIWVDIYENGTICKDTIKVIKEFIKNFVNGRACYHIQSQHSFIANQWIFSYRPKSQTKEVAMILEDDIDVSKYVWKWYKPLHKHFYLSKNVAGYSLKMQGLNLRALGMTDISVKAPQNHTIVLYNCFQAWGYSPQPNVWRQFQDWYLKVRPPMSDTDIVNRIDSIDPYVKHSVHFKWYTESKKRNFHDSLAHEMWNIYYTHHQQYLYTVYSNLNDFTNRQDVRLCDHRAEGGLHFKGNGRTNTQKYLLDFWNDSFIEFPSNPYKLSLNGQHEN